MPRRHVVELWGNEDPAVASAIKQHGMARCLKLYDELKNQPEVGRVSKVMFTQGLSQLKQHIRSVVSYVVVSRIIEVFPWYSFM